MPYTNSYLDDVLVRMAYHSSGIEGNTISLPETVSIILENALPTGRKSVREFYEIDNHKGAFSYILDLLSHHAPLKYVLTYAVRDKPKTPETSSRGFGVVWYWKKSKEENHIQIIPKNKLARNSPQSHSKPFYFLTI